MERVFVVLRSRGPAWDDSKPLESQAAWAAHAEFMDALFEEGLPRGGSVDGQRSPGYQADQSLATTTRHRRVVAGSQGEAPRHGEGET